MLCPECHHFNPDNNRFCGQCGYAFPKEPVSHYPREGFDEEVLNSEAGPEIADIDPRIPANEYSPQRESWPVEPKTPLHEVEPVEPAHVAPEEPRARNSTSIFDLEPRASERPKFETDPRAVKPITYGTNMFEYDPVAAERSSNGIHGPSFLGLGDPDFMDEVDEPPSHTRRNWLVVALLVVIAVAAVEWRNIRATGMQYAGTMRLSLPNKKGEGQAKITPEQTAPTASGETSAAGEGKPEIVVGETNSAAKPAGEPASQNAASANGNPPAAEKSTDQNSGTSASAQNDGKKNSDATDLAANKKPDETPAAAAKADKSSDDSTDDGADTTAAAAKPSKTVKAATKRPSKFVEDATSASAAGADDLARAEKASDPATAANWLWAATKKGNTDAPVRLADYYANGRGVPKDCEQATVLLRSSARRGNPRARARLGMYYATGLCVAQDRPQAWHWLSLAHQADPGSDWIEQYRQRLWSQMTPDERARSNSSSTASE